MDHEAMKTEIFALYDGALTGSARQAAERHLHACAECQALLARWTQTARAAFAVDTLAPSEAFVRGVMDRIERQEQTRRARRWTVTLRWMAPALALAGVLAAVFGPTKDTVSLDALLLADARGSAWALAAQPTTVDDVLGLVMEEQ